MRSLMFKTAAVAECLALRIDFRKVRVHIPVPATFGCSLHWMLIYIKNKVKFSNCGHPEFH